MRYLSAESLADAAKGRYRNHGVVLGPMHPDCIEMRAGLPAEGCEFDGRISVQRFKGRYYLYARANMRREGGGRFVQVTSAASPEGPWAPFQLVAFQGRYDWCMASKNNVYSSAVKTNPADHSTLLGVFPFTGPGTGLNSGERPRRRYAHIALAVSCDGVHFSEPLPVLRVSRDWWGRPNDLPVDGYVLRGDSVYFFVHEVSHAVTSALRGRHATVATYRVNPLSVRTSVRTGYVPTLVLSCRCEHSHRYHHSHRCHRCHPFQNMPFTYDWPHATGRHSRIMKHAVPIARLRRWTDEMKATLPSCAPPHLNSTRDPATSEAPSDVESGAAASVQASGGGAAQGKRGLAEPAEGLASGLGRGVDHAVVPAITTGVEGRSSVHRRALKSKRKADGVPHFDRFGCRV